MIELVLGLGSVLDLEFKYRKYIYLYSQRVQHEKRRQKEKPQ